MGKNLAGKTASIIAVLVIFFYGIFFGFNAPKMGSLKTLITNNINLGLDLKGGTHLVLEVHVAEAIASAVDRDAARLEADLQKAGITGVTVGRTDPAHPQTIVVSGIPAGKLGDVRNLVQGVDYANYEVTTAPDGSLMLTMKQAAMRDLSARTLETSIETIRERIDKLGVCRAGDPEVWTGREPDPGGAAGRERSGARRGGHSVDGQAGDSCCSGWAVGH